jgi:hypothetical protein
MKQLILLVIALITFFGLHAQSPFMKIIDKKDLSVLNSTVINIIGDASNYEIKREYYATIENHDSLLIGIKRQELSIVPGTYDYYCWKVCYLPIAAGSLPTWYAVDSLRLYKNDTVSNFSVYYQPEMKLGKACYRYVFYAENQPGDSAYVDICFDMQTVGISNHGSSGISIYPNPASSSFVINLPQSFDAAAKVELIGMSGQVILEERISALNTEVPLNEVSPGLYMLRLTNATEVIHTQKLMVN